MKGTVIKIESVLSLVDTEQGVLACAVRSRLAESDTGETKPLCVGDEVEVELTGKGEGVITAAHPRRTLLSRAHPRDPRLEHVVLSNVDQLLIVASVRQPPLRVGLIDRYIIAADMGGLDPVICINKVDLADQTREHEQIAGVYRGLDYPVVLTSAETGEGLDELKASLKDKSTALAGHSGVGKSSLINAIQPGLELKTAPVDTRGRHCTSTVSLLKLDFGGYVVDTPGIRELRLWDIERRDVAEFYPEVWERSHECHMPDCIHIHENGCAVKAAVESGEISRLRYEGYVNLVDSVEELKVPRRTDVEKPDSQVPQIKRRPSRHTQKQKMEKRLREEMDNSDDPTSASP